MVQIKQFYATYKDVIHRIVLWGEVIAVVIAVVTLPHIYKEFGWPWNFEYIAMTLSAVIFLLIFCLIYFHTQLDKLNKEKCDALEELRSLRGTNTDLATSCNKFAEGFKEIISGMYYDRWVKKGRYDENDKRAAFKNFVQYSLNITEGLFTQLTGQKCACCIKLLKRNQVETYLRDDDSSHDRSEIDKVHPRFNICENSAFSALVDKNRLGRFYLCNDIDEKGDNFKCHNPNRRRYYNACLIVPIQFVEQINGVSVKRVLIGFLCVDSKTAKFNEEVDYRILSAFANLYFHLFNARGNLGF